MKKYIQKFSSPEAADMFDINDIPFITSVVGSSVQNLTCSRQGKLLENINDKVYVATPIATDATNKPLMDCARANGWIREGARFMTDADASCVTSLLETPDFEVLVFNIMNEEIKLEMTNFYQIVNPNSIDRIEDIILEEDPNVVTQISVDTVDTTKGIYDNNGIVLENSNTLRWWDVAVKLEIEGNEYIIPCVLDESVVDEDSIELNNVLCVTTKCMKNAYYAVDPSIRVSLNDFKRINDPESADRDGSGIILPEDLTDISVVSIDTNKGPKEDGGITLSDGTTLRWWDVAFNLSIVGAYYAAVLNVGEEGEGILIIYEGAVPVGSAFSSYSITSFNEFQYFTGITDISGIAVRTGRDTEYYPLFPSTLTNITLPNTIKKISDNCFYGCKNLTSITLPESVTTIGHGAFGMCGLTNINIPYGVTRIGEAAFAYCQNLISATIPNTVTHIDRYAFGRTGLTSITIPNSVTSIGFSAFSDTGLTSIEIPTSVTCIGGRAFVGCDNLTDVYIHDINKWCEIQFEEYDANPLYFGTNLYLNNDLVTSVTINSTTINQCAFYNYTNLTTVYIGDFVTSIGNSSFKRCTGLTSVIVGNGVTSIGNYAFNACSNLTTVTLGNSVTNIGKDAFRNCTNLTSINIPNTVVSIGQSAFMGCIGEEINGVRYADKYLIEVVSKSSTTYTIKDGTKWIGTCAFKGCSSLANLEIPNTVISLEYEAFYGCRNLGNIVIPINVEHIGSYAFRECNSINITCLPINPPSIDYSMIYDTPNYMIYVPSESVNIYKIAEEWSNYAQNIQAIPA